MESSLDNLAAGMLACGDVTRLRILNLLYVEHELCVYDMVGVIGASQPKISRHLAYLRRAGLVSYRKDGLWVYYRLGSRVANANGILLDALEFILRSIASLDEDLSTLARVRREALATEGRKYAAVPEKGHLEQVPDPQPESEPEPEPYSSYESALEVELL